MMLILLLINFYVDPIIFRTSAPGLYYIEFNCEIPYQELKFEPLNDSIISNTNIYFRLVDKRRGDSLVDTLARRFGIISFSEAIKRQVSFLVQFGMFIPEGQFQYELILESKDKRCSQAGIREVNKEMYDKASDILVASAIIQDTSLGYFQKGELTVIPRPSRRFSDDHKNLFIYYELYDLEIDTNKLAVVYTIEDSTAKVIRKFPRTIEKRFSPQAVNFGTPIAGFGPGTYKLKVAVFNPSLAESLTKEVSFQIAGKPDEVSLATLPYYEEIEYFVSSDEFKRFSQMSGQGRIRYLKKFWQVHNYQEIVRRFEYAKKHYSEGGKSGKQTDRGRIYIKYGPCDEIEKSFFETQESRPFEHWRYYQGDEFIFVDTRRTGEYILVWSKTTDEQSQPSLFKYLNKEMQKYIGQR